MARTVVVAGALANKPMNGGSAWTRLSWIVGFQRLGFEVYFIEEISPEVCTDHSGNVAPIEESLNLEFFNAVVEEFHLTTRAGLLCRTANAFFGLSREDWLDLAGSVELLVNISGILKWPVLMQLFRRKAFIDLDPGFTQVWHEQGQLPGLRRHDIHFTVGENIGRPACSIGTGDIAWVPTRQPVVLEQWQPSPALDRDRLTTIASWRGPFGAIRIGDRLLGSKAHEFRRFAPLPSRVEADFEIALHIDPSETTDLELLRNNQWGVVDPSFNTGSPGTFRNYVRGSGAEFSVANGVYVHSNSGWFSDRSVRYLASGKPVLVQDTGFSRNLPTGEGLLCFHTIEDAVAGVEQIRTDYDFHCRMARQVAVDCFDSDQIIGRLLEASS